MPILHPSMFWHLMMLADFFYPFIYTSKYVEMYHSFIMAGLPDLPEIPAIELSRDVADLTAIRKASADFTRPLVIRKAFMNTAAQKLWGNASWWRENYGEDDVMVSSR
jgi:hypothetical protein